MICEAEAFRGLCCMQVMSQQTQLPRVVEYFNRWIAKWPTVKVRILTIA